MFTFISDPGHGWLEVTTVDLARVGMRCADFTRYSYRHGNPDSDGYGYSNSHRYSYRHSHCHHPANSNSNTNTLGSNGLFTYRDRLHGCN
jgi:hypothetical protein